MALATEYGTFVHIPKTGGTWVRSVIDLYLIRNWEVAGTYPSKVMESVWHQVPESDGPAFVVIRHPATWLRSYWGHRNAHGWHPEQSWIDAALGGLDWPTFARDYVAQFPGGVGKMMRAYAEAIEGTRICRLESLAWDLSKAIHIDAEQLALTCPQNPGPNDLPNIEVELRARIEDAEPWLMERYQ